MDLNKMCYSCIIYGLLNFELQGNNTSEDVKWMLSKKLGVPHERFILATKIDV